MKKFFPAILPVVSLITVCLFGCSSTASQQTDVSSAAPPSQTSVESESKTAETADFPVKYLDFIIGFSAGTGADTNGRLLCSQAEGFLGQSIAVTNKDGAGGALAYSYAASQKPDGYTLIWNSNSQSITHYSGNMENSIDDFKQVCRISLEDNVLAVASNSKWETFEEFAEDVKAHPGQYICSNGGIGGYNHLAAAALQNALGSELQHIPLGGGDQITAMQSGEVDCGVASLANYMKYVESGDVRILASLGAESPACDPSIPTAKSFGYDVVMSMYRGISVPKDTPDEIVAIISDAFRQAVETPAYKEYAEKNNITISFMDSAEFTEYVKEDDAYIRQLMIDIGMVQ
ncbi:tripartite tricarboxylate transporter substrate binding protein [Lachnospiraceae bacterium 62-35]